MPTDREIAHSLGQTVSSYTQATTQSPGYVFDVRSYGARPRPFDSTEAFLRAIEATPPGQTLSVPPGDYQVSQTLKITKSIRLIGSGLSSIYLPRVDQPLLVFDARSNKEPSGALSLQVEDLELVDGSVGIDVIGFMNPYLTRMRGIHFAGQSVAGLRIQPPGGLLSGVFDSLVFSTQGHGVYCAGDELGGDLLGNTTWINCNWNGCGAGFYGFYASEPQPAVMPNILMLNPIFQSLQGRAVYIKGTELTIDNGHFEACCMGESTNTGEIHIDDLSTLELRSGRFAPPEPGKDVRIKLLRGNARLFAQNVRSWGGSPSKVDRNNLGGSSRLCLDSMGFGSPPTVINGAWNWVNGPV